jgi:adenine-specific DNA-methyltransferase
MPTLEFKGKASVYAHHLSVPFRELVPVAKKSLPADGAAPSLDDNLIIHGDNLEALKALLPRYAGKVDVIYIDPPYNTGNEGWAYNDNVNSPLMKGWLGKVVDREDLERHDKWLCMMWPRLELLRELLSPTGLFFMSIDENEIGNALLLVDEVFGRDNRVETLIWKKSYGGGAKEKHFVTNHEYVLCYAFEKENLYFLDRPISEDKITRYYLHKDEWFEERGPYRLKPLEATESMDERLDLRYSIEAPDGTLIKPRRQWWWGEDRFKRTKEWGGIEFLNGKNGWSVQYKQYLKVADGENRNEKPFSIINPPSVFVGPYTQEGTAELREIFDGESPVPFPKPTRLINELLSIIKPGDQGHITVLDSFAGSGTTAHAVLKANEDGGNRKFILIETEDYADTLTAERVRRVIGGGNDPFNSH